jgi:hypothetical protein
MDTRNEPAFAWYRLEGRESALLLIFCLILCILCSIVWLRGDAPRALPATSTELPPAAVHVNRASVAELSALPGIGPRKAERIVSARQANKIRSLEELAHAAGGIPRAEQQRMEPFVRFDP